MSEKKSFTDRISKFRKLANQKIKTSKSVSFGRTSFKYAPEKAYIDFCSKYEDEHDLICFQKQKVSACEYPIFQHDKYITYKEKLSKDFHPIFQDDKKKVSVLIKIITVIADKLSDEKYETEDIVVYDNDPQDMGGNATYCKRRSWATALRVSPEDDDLEQRSVKQRSYQNKPEPSKKGLMKKALGGNNG